ncbi:uncharacterized protein LOC115634555 [Scaptodrosophila lebanonensis]|uniref:Uncharacterized protein LOC115634555 n=1 Tax=Drosophila lebanonensis TaxID=7225 RepID=A0A6J2UIJ7_DROLE|nr:uncharacterized protein LOC115634555 [Scaptodrosophila lebanonensis]
MWRVCICEQLQRLLSGPGRCYAQAGCGRVIKKRSGPEAVTPCSEYNVQQKKQRELQLRQEHQQQQQQQQNQQQSFIQPQPGHGSASPLFEPSRVNEIGKIEEHELFELGEITQECERQCANLLHALNEYGNATATLNKMKENAWRSYPPLIIEPPKKETEEEPHKTGIVYGKIDTGLATNCDEDYENDPSELEIVQHSDNYLDQRAQAEQCASHECIEDYDYEHNYLPVSSDRHLSPQMANDQDTSQPNMHVLSCSQNNDSPQTPATHPFYAEDHTLRPIQRHKNCHLLPQRMGEHVAKFSNWEPPIEKRGQKCHPQPYQDVCEGSNPKRSFPRIKAKSPPDCFPKPKMSCGPRAPPPIFRSEPCVGSEFRDSRETRERASSISKSTPPANQKLTKKCHPQAYQDVCEEPYPERFHPRIKAKPAPDCLRKQKLSCGPQPPSTTFRPGCEFEDIKHSFHSPKKSKKIVSHQSNLDCPVRKPEPKCPKPKPQKCKQKLHPCDARCNPHPDRYNPRIEARPFPTCPQRPKMTCGPKPPKPLFRPGPCAEPELEEDSQNSCRVPKHQTAKKSLEKSHSKPNTCCKPPKSKPSAECPKPKPKKCHPKLHPCDARCNPHQERFHPRIEARPYPTCPQRPKMTCGPKTPKPIFRPAPCSSPTEQCPKIENDPPVCDEYEMPECPRVPESESKSYSVDVEAYPEKKTLQNLKSLIESMLDMLRDKTQKLGNSEESSKDIKLKSSKDKDKTLCTVEPLPECDPIHHPNRKPNSKKKKPKIHLCDEPFDYHNMRQVPRVEAIQGFQYADRPKLPCGPESKLDKPTLRPCYPSECCPTVEKYEAPCSYSLPKCSVEAPQSIKPPASTTVDSSQTGPTKSPNFGSSTEESNRFTGFINMLVEKTKAVGNKLGQGQPTEDNQSHTCDGREKLFKDIKKCSSEQWSRQLKPSEPSERFKEERKRLRKWNKLLGSSQAKQSYMQYTNRQMELLDKVTQYAKEMQKRNRQRNHDRMISQAKLGQSVASASCQDSRQISPQCETVRKSCMCACLSSPAPMPPEDNRSQKHSRKHSHKKIYECITQMNKCEAEAKLQKCMEEELKKTKHACLQKSMASMNEMDRQRADCEMQQLENEVREYCREKLWIEQCEKLEAAERIKRECEALEMHQKCEEAAKKAEEERLKKHCLELICKEVQSVQENVCEDEEHLDSDGGGKTDANDFVEELLKKCRMQALKEEKKRCKELEQRQKGAQTDSERACIKQMLQKCKAELLKRKCEEQSLKRKKQEEEMKKKCIAEVAIKKKCAEEMLKKQCQELLLLNKCKKMAERKKTKELNKSCKEQRNDATEHDGAETDNAIVTEIKSIIKQCEKLKRKYEKRLKEKCMNRELKMQCAERESANRKSREAEQQRRRKEAAQRTLRDEAEHKRRVKEAEEKRKCEEAEMRRKCKKAEQERKCEEAEQKRKCEEAEQKRKCEEADRKRKCEEAEQKRKCEEAEQKRKCEEAEMRRKCEKAEQERKCEEAERKKKFDAQRKKKLEAELQKKCKKEARLKRKCEALEKEKSVADQTKRCEEIRQKWMGDKGKLKDWPETKFTTLVTEADYIHELFQLPLAFHKETIIGVDGADLIQRLPNNSYLLDLRNSLALAEIYQLRNTAIFLDNPEVTRRKNSDTTKTTKDKAPKSDAHRFADSAYNLKRLMPELLRARLSNSLLLYVTVSDLLNWMYSKWAQLQQRHDTNIAWPHIGLLPPSCMGGHIIGDPDRQRLPMMWPSIAEGSNSPNELLRSNGILSLHSTICSDANTNINAEPELHLPLPHRIDLHGVSSLGCFQLICERQCRLLRELSQLLLVEPATWSH